MRKSGKTWKKKQKAFTCWLKDMGVNEPKAVDSLNNNVEKEDK